MIKELLEHRTELAELMVDDLSDNCLALLDVKMSDLDRLIEKAIEGQAHHQPTDEHIRNTIERVKEFVEESPVEEENPWIKNPGHEPFPEHVEVEVRLVSGEILKRHVRDFNWNKYDCLYDVDEYRVVEE
jgi:hypothetical protein